MNKVVQFKPEKESLDRIKFWDREVTIWECICGGKTFFLHKNGEVECVECTLISDGMICGEKYR